MSGALTSPHAAARRVVVNADDLGLSPGINRGIVVAHLHGLVTSTSLMVLRPHASEGVALVAPHESLSVGLHLDLVEHQVVGDAWRRTVVRVDLDDPRAVEAEVRSQLRRFVELTGRLPSHIDSHQHVHLDGPATTEVVVRVAEEHDLPVRGVSTTYRGSFYGQYGAGVPYPDGLTPAALLAAMAAGTSTEVEVGCHPAQEVDFEDTYAAERLTELAVLCDPSLAMAVEWSGVELINRSGRTRSRGSGRLAGT